MLSISVRSYHCIAANVFAVSRGGEFLLFGCKDMLRKILINHYSSAVGCNCFTF